jgi:glycerol-3-phosphate acyltransferase PlsY
MLDAADWSQALPLYAGAVLVGYLFGSIPFGLVLTRLAGTQDIRQIGSGNIGATNVLRTGRKGLAAATLLGDALKGTAAVLIVFRLWGHDAALVAGLGAFLGHLFPVWLRFRGGKGVATYIGILLGLAPLAALVFAATWLIVAVAFRYSSLAALTALAVTPLFLCLHGDRPEAALFALLSALAFVTHRENIRRLLAGTEGKIGKTKPAPPPSR